MKRVLGALLLAAAFAVAVPAHGIDDTKRGKVIDFEDEVVEGVNKRPLDSLNQISEADRKKRKPHLYRKRGGFRSETAETLRALKFTP
ncbi:MAG TPA: hypothetical protein VM598_01370 [Bdellovibrionota bacterium]|nr:hypothetical protein [Bdellovibrionota bacterium]